MERRSEPHRVHLARTRRQEVNTRPCLGALHTPRQANSSKYWDTGMDRDTTLLSRPQPPPPHNPGFQTVNFAGSPGYAPSIHPHRTGAMCAIGWIRARSANLKARWGLRPKDGENSALGWMHGGGHEAGIGRGVTGRGQTRIGSSRRTSQPTSFRRLRGRAASWPRCEVRRACSPQGRGARWPARWPC